MYADCEAGSIQRSGVRPYVCPIYRPLISAAGSLLGAPRAGNIDRQERSRSTAVSSKCEQCRVVYRRRRRLSRDLLLFEMRLFSSAAAAVTDISTDRASHMQHKNFLIRMLYKDSY